MGLPNQLTIESVRTGKPIYALIDEALQANKTKVAAAKQLNISVQALNKRLEKRPTEIAGK